MEPQIPSDMPAKEPLPPEVTETMRLGLPARDGIESASGPGNEPEQPYRGLKWVFFGPEGLRAGWSVLIFVLLFLIFGQLLGRLLVRLNLVTRGAAFSARQAFVGELTQVIALILAAAFVALIERRSLLDYNLRGPNRTSHFFTGLLVGFCALSTLVGALALGGWLHFGPVALSGSQILKYAAVWAAVFLLVGCMEEGSMRCYLQSTLTRGLNFWWAAGIIAVLCGFLVLKVSGNGVWGVYAMALLGLFPCLWLQLSKTPQSGFWQAAWVTSTIFGAGHTGNNGENWIGIFAAAFIGFVFCVSIWVTGSAWWAIGCHAAWDWAETFFYGTADSGLVAPGHLFSSWPAGNPLWSGGHDGPEGSLLVIPIVLLILALLLIVYRRPRPAQFHAPATTEQLAS